MFKCSTKYKNVMGIYKIVNNTNLKLYIGSAVNFYDRFLHHRKRLRGNYHNNQHLQRAFNKYGEDNFTFEIIEIVDNKDELLEREQFWLDYTQCYNKDVGYNIAKNATAPMLGKTWTDEQRKKFIKSRKGVPQPEGFRDRMSRLHKGKTVPQDVRDKISESCRNSWSDDMKREQSDRMKNRWKYDREFIESNKNKVVEFSDEERKRISERKKGSNHHNARLTEEEVREIKIMLRDGVDRKSIMKMFDVSEKNLSKIATGVTWKHVKI